MALLSQIDYNQKEKKHENTFTALHIHSPAHTQIIMQTIIVHSALQISILFFLQTDLHYQSKLRSKLI